MKTQEFLKEIKKLDAAGLNKKAHEIAEEMMKLRFRKASGQLQQSHMLKKLQRDLARVQTLISSQAA